ncbi:MAG: glycosyltransferase, partial [Gammaproteobacteria bacterium]
MASEKRLTVVQMLPALEMGGVEKGTLEMSRFLVEQGHRSIVISEGGQMLPALMDQGGEHLNWPVGVKHLWTLRLINRVRDFLIKNHVDILHLRSRMPAWIGYLAWRGIPPNNRPRLVTTVHGFYSVNPYSAVMTKGERVIAVSESVRCYIRKNYPKTSDNRIEVIHRGVDPLRYPYGFQPDKEWYSNWHYPTADRYVVTLPGRLTAWKGQMEFIELIHHLKQDNIPVLGLIVGEAHPRRLQFKEKLKNRITSLGLEKDIILTGQRRDLREIMAISDVVLSMSKDPEAFGRTTLEALSLGKPVAGYEHGGVAEQLQALLPEGQIPVGDVQSLSHCLRHWYHERPEVKRNNPFTLQNMLRKTHGL